MEWIQRFNDAMQYIEQHLDDEISYDQIAQIAYCSPYHFQRMFSYMAEVTLCEYIRRRRMTMAAIDLQSTSAKVLDLSIKYGYDSPTAFNRAFQSVHGIPPTQARTEGVALKAYPVISFKMTIKGDAEMNYRIEKKEAIRVIGVSMPLSKVMEENMKVIPQFWNKTAMDGTIGTLASYIKEAPQGILGVSVCNDEENWSYLICVSNSDATLEGMEVHHIPAATWAIFPGTGTMPQSIQELEKRIFSEWLPNSGYEYANAPDIEVYISPNPQNSVFEVWVPITKKERS